MAKSAQLDQGRDGASGVSGADPRPEAKGWCPGALTPMRSGDGLIVRVRPRAGQLSAAQVLGLCAAAAEYGSGMLDLTSRANLQIRGVQDAGLAPLQSALWELGLLDATDKLEERRNILAAPLRGPGDQVTEFSAGLEARLAELPDLPGKFGFAIDCAQTRQLSTDSADIRLERSPNGLIVRADGANLGRAVTPETAIEVMLDLAHWFAQTRGQAADAPRRMRAVADQLPQSWCQTAPGPVAARLNPGPLKTGLVLGAPFGSIPAPAFADLMRASAAHVLITTPWRLFVLSHPLQPTNSLPVQGFVTAPDDPLLNTDACPGAPFCKAATVETRALAAQLATDRAPDPTGPKTAAPRLHVSGCAKGCAYPRPAARTLVGREGRFDLVIEGSSWEEPARRGLSPAALISGMEPL